MLSVALQAQPEVFFGALVGINKSKFKFQDFKDEYLQNFAKATKYTSKATKTGFQGGVRVGINLGPKLSIITEPYFAAQNVEYGTLNSTSEFVKNIDKSNSGSPVYDYILGKRFWEIQMNSVTIPLYARFKLLGNDKFGIYVNGGFSWRKFFSNSTNTDAYKTVFKPDQDLGTAYNSEPGNPVVEAYRDNNDAAFYAFDDSYKSLYNVIGHFRYSSQFPNNTNSSFTFGSSDTDHMTGTNWNLILGTSLRYVVDDEGKFAVTFDLNWNRGLSNMYTKARITKLDQFNKSKYQPQDVDNINPDPFANRNYTPASVKLINSQTMNTTLISIGFEFCPSCGGW